MSSGIRAHGPRAEQDYFSGSSLIEEFSILLGCRVMLATVNISAEEVFFSARHC